MYLAFQLDKHLYLRKTGNGDTIRFLNHPLQLALVEKYYRHVPLEICSLNHFDTTKLHKPEYMLDQMDEKVPIGADKGGWRALTDPEAYALIIGTCPPPVGNLASLSGLQSAVLESLNLHPFLKAGGDFCHSGVVPLSLLNLMIYIYDINRFGSFDEMLKFFRLDKPDSLMRFFEQKQATPDTVRPSLVFLAWFASPFRTLQTEILQEIPCAFLFIDYMEFWKVYKFKNDEQTSEYLSLWEVTRRFLFFVFSLWKAGVSGEKEYLEKLFARPSEVKAFREYINKIDGGLTTSGKWDIRNRLP